MSSYADPAGAMECIVLLGFERATTDQFHDAKTLFTATKLVNMNGVVGRYGASVEGSVRKNPNGDGILYLLAYTSAATKDTAINVYDRIYVANAIMTRERFVWVYSNDDADDYYPKAGDWKVKETDIFTASHGRQLTAGANRACVFAEGACNEVCGVD